MLLVGPGLVEDARVRRGLAGGLAMAEFVDDVAAAERLMPRCHFDCIVVEALSARDPVLRWVDQCRQADGHPRFIVVGPDEASLVTASRRSGAVAFLPLPLEPNGLLRALQQPFEMEPEKGARQPSRIRRAAGRGARVEFVGESDALRRIRSLIERVAPTPATVLLEGQTGTGKELVARLIHESSGRRGPFIPVNCGAIPPELMESELFGHAKGAFTGAHQLREGLFVAARGGTLFLDEISEMRSDLQVKLLRALEEGAIRPVGSDRELPIDVRIVASSQPGLRERVLDGRFREDLFYRLNVVHVALPSLCQRPEDIPQLVEHFMRRVTEEFDMLPVALSESDFAGLQRRDWPGNVRELRNLVERTVLMGSLPEPDTAAAAPERAGGRQGYPLSWTLEQVKQAHMERVLEGNGGNRSAAARQLGVSRKTLERRLGAGESRTRGQGGEDEINSGGTST